MLKTTVALLLALALVVMPSMAAADDWQVVETWDDTVKNQDWENVETWITYSESLLVIGRPILIYPDNASSITDNTPIFRWVAGYSADSQRFLLDNDITFASPTENILLYNDATTYAIITSLLDDNYYWKVIAILSGIENSSDVFNFELISPLAPGWQHVESWGDTMKTKDWENVEIWTTSLIIIPLGDYPSKGVNYLHTGVANIVSDPPYEFLWKKNILGTFDEFSGPIAVDGLVYIANKWADNIFRALTLKSGTEVWSYELNAGVDGAPLWYDDKVYVGTGITRYDASHPGSGSIASLYAFDDDNGDLLWRYDGYNNSYWTSTPWVRAVDDFAVLEDFENIDDWDKSGSVVLDNTWKTEGTYSVKITSTADMTRDFNFGDIDNLMFDWTKNFSFMDDEFCVYIGDNLVFKYYYDGDSWETIGSLPINTENYTGVQTLKFYVHSSTRRVNIDYLRTTNRQIVYWVDGRDIVALDADNGDLIWSDTLSTQNHPFVGVCYNGITYTPGKTGSYAISAYNAVTGSYLWGGINYTVWDSGITVDAENTDNVVLFVGTRPMRVLAVDADNGMIFWNRLIDNGGIPQNSYILTVPVVWENKLYVGGKKYHGYNYWFYCLDKFTGDDIWAVGGSGTPTYHMTYTTPVILPVSGRIVMYSKGYGQLEIRDADNGALIWSYQIGSSYSGQVAVVDSYILISSDSGYLYVFGAGVGLEWITVDTWINTVDVEAPPTPPPEPPADDVVWVVFAIRFLSVFGPLGFMGWHFTKIKDPMTGIRAGVYIGVGFVALVLLWFTVDAIEAILLAI